MELNDLSKGIKIDHLYVPVFIADRIGLKYRKLSSKGL